MSVIIVMLPVVVAVIVIVVVVRLRVWLRWFRRRLGRLWLRLRGGRRAGVWLGRHVAPSQQRQAPTAAL
jgi:hypothetical protein